ncbi:UNVERIFIED_CONTAM: hypothetical protein RMT77_004753 [Armadillidium vulgare]
MKIFALLLFCFLTVCTGESKLHHTKYDENVGIIGGSEATPHSYPWQVALYIDDDGFCGGALISDEWILTAAHCISGASSVEVVLGAHNLTDEEPSQVRIVVTGEENFVINSGFSTSTYGNDIGLVHLPEPVTFTAEIQAANLPKTTESDLADGYNVNVTGWGYTDEGVSQLSDVLLEVPLVTILNSDCVNYYSVAAILPQKLCTSGESLIGTCTGDDGGSLNFEKDGVIYLRAVASFIPPAGCQSGYPDTFQRTTQYLSWITQETGIKT